MISQERRVLCYRLDAADGLGWIARALCVVLLVGLGSVAMAQSPGREKAPPDLEKAPPDPSVAGAAEAVDEVAQQVASEAIQPKPAPPPRVHMTDAGGVELHVADLPLATVLEMLSVKSRRNIVASPDVSGTVTAHIYDATLEEALDAILLTNGAGYRVSGNFVFVHTNDELKEMDAASAAPPVTRVFRLNYLRAADAKAFIEPMLGEIGTVSATAPPSEGLASNAQEAGGNANAAADFIVVTAPAELVEQAALVLQEVDVRPRQVLIEATILRAELNDDNALGIDFSIVGGVDLEQLSAVSNGIADLALGTLPTERFEQFNASASTSMMSDFQSGGLTLGIIKDKVGVFLRALEEVTDTTVLANPKVLALNKQKGQVIVGRRDGFLTTTVTETQSIQTVEFLETGTQLLFRPFIGEDGFVRMELHPEDSVGFISAQGLPSEQTTEVTTNVVVRDGDTILIGGLFREVSTDTRSQVPGLGNIPVFGQLFRSNSDSTTREEVIILLTVNIVKDHALYAEESARTQLDLERIRVGVRQGLMWHGRERLAQGHYRRAVKAYEAGDDDRALWHVNMALHNFPRMRQALDLREELLGEPIWEEDGMGGRDFLHRIISRERGYVAPMFNRPGPPFTRQAGPDSAAQGEAQ